MVESCEVSPTSGMLDPLKSGSEGMMRTDLERGDVWTGRFEAVNREQQFIMTNRSPGVVFEAAGSRRSPFALDDRQDRW